MGVGFELGSENCPIPAERRGAFQGLEEQWRSHASLEGKQGKGSEG